MDQLLKVTTTPFQTIRFTQNARLLPADNIMMERHKALARHNALKQSYRPGSSTIDLDYINQVNLAFSEKHSGSGAAATAPSQSSNPMAADLPSRPPVESHPGYSAVSENVISKQPVIQKEVSGSESTRQTTAASSEISSSYAVQRGSFELRVAKGELSYVPPLVMTIVTQYPDVEFEYIGGFNYFPSPEEEISENTMNLTI